MRLLLVSPPFGDPTLPPLGCATLTACVNETKRHVAYQTDLNVRLLNALISKPIIESSLSILRSRPTNSLFERIVSSAAREALPEAVEEAKRIFRDKQRFFQAVDYRTATNAVELAYQLLNATLFPWQLIGEFNGIKHSELIVTTANDHETQLRSFIEQPFNPVRTLLDEILEDCITQTKPDLVGISQVYDSQVLITRYMAHAIKLKWPSLKILVGGTSLTEHLDRMQIEAETVWNSVFGGIDYLMPGEAERPLVALLDCLEQNHTLTRVPNLVYLDRTGRSVQNSRIRESNLDSLPPPAFNCDELCLYWAPTPVITIAPTRGCYWDKCAFCAYGLREGDRATAPYREMSAKLLADHLCEVLKTTGSSHCIFAVDVIRSSTAENFAEEFAGRGLPFVWQAETRPESSLLKPDRLKKLHRGGLRHLSFGIESCSQGVLDSMDKGTKVMHFGALLRALNHEGIAADLMLFSGFPGETAEQLQETITFLRQHEDLLHRPVTLGRFHLIDGCRVERQAEQFGVLVEIDSASTAVFRPGSYSWSLKQPTDLGPDIRSVHQKQDLSTSAGPKTPLVQLGTYIGRRPWVGATGAAHTFLYFASAGLASVKHYNAFVMKLQDLLLDRVFAVPMAHKEGRPHETTR